MLFYVFNKSESFLSVFFLALWFLLSLEEAGISEMEFWQLGTIFWGSCYFSHFTVIFKYCERPKGSKALQCDFSLLAATKNHNSHVPTQLGVGTDKIFPAKNSNSTEKGGEIFFFKSMEKSFLIREEDISFLLPRIMRYEILLKTIHNEDKMNHEEVLFCYCEILMWMGSLEVLGNLV